MDEEKKEITGQEGEIGSDPKDPSNPNPSGADDSNPGKGKGGSGPRGGKHGGGKGAGKGTKDDDANGVYLGVRSTQKSELNAQTQAVDDSGFSAVRIKGTDRSTTEDVIGRSIVVEAEATNLKYGEGTSFIDAKKMLPDQLTYFNSPLKDMESVGEMHQIDKVEELIGIPTLPCDEGNIVYPKNQKVEDGKIVVDSTSKAPVSGVYVGQFLQISQKKITGVYYADCTPTTDFKDITVDEDSIADTNASGHYRHREAALAEKKMSAFENSKDKGIAKNPLYKAPCTEQILQLMMDIIRHTTMTVERAYLCCCEFMASISQDRYVYGTNQNKMFEYFMSWLEPVYELRADAKKIHSVSDIVNIDKLEFITHSWDVWKKFNGAYCYPKTTIAYKEPIQSLLMYSKVSRDHRAVYTRANLAYVAPYLYDDVTYVNGEKQTGVGIGGSTDRSFYSFEDGNDVPIYVKDPIFDGIQDMFTSNAMKGHVWNTSGKTCTIPLTFDPKFPTFALLVMKSVPKIISILETMCTDLYQYISEGGTLPSSFQKYPFAKMDAFIKSAGYGSDNWHDTNKGVTCVIDPVANLRVRYPEFMTLMKEESDDGDSQFSYYPGIMSPFTVGTDGTSFNMTGIFNFPAGSSKVISDRFATILDPVIFVDATGYRSGATLVAIDKASTGTKKNISFKMPYVKAAKLSLKKYLKGRRLTGLIFGIPTGVVPYNPNTVVMTDGSIGEVNAANIKSAMAKTLNDVNYTDLSPRLDRGIQLSSYRMEFALPIDQYKAAHVYVCNDTHLAANLKADVALAFDRAGYTNDQEGRVGYYVTISSGKASTGMTPAELIKFPFAWIESVSADIADDKGSEKGKDSGDAPDNALLICFERWSYHAPFLHMYVNPFYGIRESKTTGIQDASALVKSISHQKMINSLFYWQELDSSITLNHHRARMDADIDLVEPSIFSV